MYRHVWDTVPAARAQLGLGMPGLLGHYGWPELVGKPSMLSGQAGRARQIGCGTAAQPTGRADGDLLRACTGVHSQRFLQGQWLCGLFVHGCAVQRKIGCARLYKISAQPMGVADWLCMDMHGYAVHGQRFLHGERLCKIGRVWLCWLSRSLYSNWLCHYGYARLCIGSAWPARQLAVHGRDGREQEDGARVMNEGLRDSIRQSGIVDEEKYKGRTTELNADEFNLATQEEIARADAARCVGKIKPPTRRWKRKQHNCPSFMVRCR
jgi:hypothetical protein